MRTRMFVAVVVALVGACPAVTRAGDEPDPLVPRDVFFGNPDRAAAELSPDGTKLAFIAPVDSVLNIWVGPADDPDAAKPVTKDTGRGLRQFSWAYTSEHIIYQQDVNNDENWRVYSVDLASGTTTDLTPFDSIPGADGKPATMNGKPLRPAARVVAISANTPDEIIIGLNNRNPSLHDLYRCRLSTGKLTLLKQNDGFLSYVLDESFTIRFAARYMRDAKLELLRRSADDQFTLFTSILPEDSMLTGPIGFDREGNTFFMTDSRGRDTAVLKALDLQKGSERVLLSDPRADVGQALQDPRTLGVDAMTVEHEKLEWKVINPAIQPDIDYLLGAAPGAMRVITRTMADDKWLVMYSPTDGAPAYYLYNRSGGAPGTAKKLFSTRPALDSLKLAPRHPIVIQSRDDLPLVSYLTLPTWSDPDGDGRPDRPLPMVLLVHDGPWTRDSWTYDPYHQWLANRGYAVLSTNYRGSTGFGKKFVNASNGEWGRKMQDDLVTAATWAVKEKIADPAKVGIMGGSYGGYAALAGLTFTPETFACAVDIVGPSNLLTLMSNIPQQWAPFAPVLTQRIGDPRTEEGKRMLSERSPLNFVERIRKPLLVGQGANDPRSRVADTERIVSGMQTRKVPVVYVLYPDEGHGLQRPENGKSFSAITEVFLAKYLGGRAEPIGDVVAKSSAQIKAGADLVEGLGKP